MSSSMAISCLRYVDRKALTDRGVRRLPCHFMYPRGLLTTRHCSTWNIEALARIVHSTLPSIALKDGAVARISEPEMQSIQASRSQPRTTSIT